MLKRLKGILFAVCTVMLFTAQVSRPDDQKKHDNQGRQQAQSHREKSAPREAPRPRETARPRGTPQQRETPRQREVPQQREIPHQEVHRQPAEQARFQPARQERTGPRVYGVLQSTPVENNNLFQRQHHKHWQPRYNYYDDQYHFYPYVNIASVVELSGGYLVVGPDGQNYYYDQGTFYLQDSGGQYEAVPPPIGIIVNPLAANARQIIANGQIFYRYKGIFYVQVAQGYQVIGPVQYDSDSS